MNEIKEELPNDIDLENRKDIIREALGKIFGKPRKELTIEKLLEARVLNLKLRAKKKLRRKLSETSKRRNRR